MAGIIRDLMEEREKAEKNKILLQIEEVYSNDKGKMINIKSRGTFSELKEVTMALIMQISKETGEPIQGILAELVVNLAMVSEEKKGNSDE